MQYSDLVREYFERPRHAGPVGGPVATAARGTAGRVADGVFVQFTAQVRAETATELGFNAYGCPYTIAIASRLTETRAGKPISEVADIDVAGLAAELGIPDEKLVCILTAQDALAALAEDWKGRGTT